MSMPVGFSDYSFRFKIFVTHYIHYHKLRLNERQLVIYTYIMYVWPTVHRKCVCVCTISMYVHDISMTFRQNTVFVANKTFQKSDKKKIIGFKSNCVVSEIMTDVLIFFFVIGTYLYFVQWSHFRCSLLLALIVITYQFEENMARKYFDILGIDINIMAS